MKDKAKIFSVPNTVWQEFGIFPEVLGRRADVSKVRTDASEQFRKMGKGNLRLLCEEFQVAVPDGSDKEAIASLLLDRFPADLLVHAFEFQKKRSRAIQELFNGRYPKAKSVAKRVSQLSANPDETLDNRSRLLLLLNRSESNLKDIFYLSSWLSKDTTFRFHIKDQPETIYSKQIVDNLAKLTSMLDACSDLGGERLGHHDLNGRALVIVHLRKYRPRVYRDYETTHNLHHMCGTLIMGISHVDGFLHVKSSSKNVADTVQRFLEEELAFDVERMEEKVVTNFRPEPLSRLMAGKIPEDSPFKLAAIAFTRTTIGSVPLSITRAPFNDSILTTLESLHDSGIISSASPIYLQSCELDYRGEHIKLVCKPIIGGALRLTYQNAGLTDALQDSMERDFEATFGVPLSRMLDPSQWSVGTSGIIAFILRAKTKEEIQDYQREVYETLVASGIIEERPESIKLCSRFGCKASPISGAEDATDCRECGAPLKLQNIKAIELSNKGMQNWVKELIASGGAWELGSRTLTFEKQKYFPITSTANPASRIASLFQHRLSRDKQRTFDRSSLPVVRFSELYDSVPLRLESDDSALVSLPYVLTTLFEPEKREHVAAELSNLFSRVHSTYDSRISRAARTSADSLESPPPDQDGDKYEVDVFNLMRWLFWHTSRLGKKGEREPDGFISLQDYRESETPTLLGQWNLGYDAKFSTRESGYDFGPEQHRQAAEYIRKYFRARKHGVKRDLRILGHAIISNDIDYEKIQSFVRHLSDEKIISATEASPVIVLIRDEFLVHLYRDLSTNDEKEFRSKRLHLHFLMIQILESKTAHLFIELGTPMAEYVLEQIKKMPPIEEALDVAELMRTSFSEIPVGLYTPQCPVFAPEKRLAGNG